MRLTFLNRVRPLVWVLCLSAAACGSDDSGGKKTEQPGDGDNAGDGDNSGAKEDGGGLIPVPGDGDGDAAGDGGAPQSCEMGATRECDCSDGTSKGEQYCIQGQFVGACNNCPCMAGDTQACFCEGGGIGSAQCVDTKFGECVCEAGGACPDNFTCQDLSGLGMGMGSACLPAGGQGPGGFGLPPQCETVADCVEAGLPNAACAQVQIIPFKLCVQSCTADEPPAGDAAVGGPGDAGT
jgi:hypothetical protein